MITVVAQGFLAADAGAALVVIAELARQVGAVGEVVFGVQIGRDCVVLRFADVISVGFTDDVTGRRIQGLAVTARIGFRARAIRTAAARAAAAIAAGAMVDVQAAVDVQLADGEAAAQVEADAAHVAHRQVETRLRLDRPTALHHDIDDAARCVRTEGRSGIGDDLDRVDVVRGQALQRKGAVVALHLGRFLAIDVHLYA